MKTLNIEAIAEQFCRDGSIKSIKPFGNGNINDTFLVTLHRGDQASFVLQGINSQVFPKPELIIQNIRIFSDHVGKKLEKETFNRRWEIPLLISTKSGEDYVCSEDNSLWRAMTFLDNSQSLETINNLQQAEETGYALGMFHYLINDLSPQQFSDTLENFHITPKYLEQYQQVISNTKIPDSPEKKYCINFIKERQNWASVLENAKNKGKISLRLMHGDPKINNILFDKTTQKAISIVDLDTIKPGLIHYDIGDCLRSGCNLMGEETQNWQQIKFDLDLCQSILQGYLGIAKNFLTDNDYKYIFDAIRLITFELGLRFFTDYLAGNIYFKTKYPEHNLIRALVQFQLTKSIEKQEKSLQKIITSAKTIKT